MRRFYTMNRELYIGYMDIIKLYGLATVIFLGIDMVWLTVVAKNFYAQQLGYLMSPTPNLMAALLFYLINIVGIVVLVLNPALKENNLNKLLFTAALYGLCTYATYDLTNLATIKNWPIIITIVDLVWGTTLTTAVAYLTFIIARNWR